VRRAVHPDAPHLLQDARQNLGGRLATTGTNDGCNQFEGFGPLAAEQDVSPVVTAWR